MQVSDSKIKTDWEKLDNLKTENFALQDKSQPAKSPKETNFVLNPFVTTQLDRIDSSLIWEKSFFDNLGIDQNVITEFGKLCDTVIKEAGVSLDAYGRIFQIQSDMVSNSIAMYNNFFNQGLDWYSKFMSNFISKK